MQKTRPSKYFNIGSEVKAVSLTGQKIIGYYRGARGSFGVYVYGFVADQEPVYTVHVCLRITMELLKPPVKPVPVKQKRLEYGEYCQGRMKDGKVIIGYYAGYAPVPYAYIRGTVEGINLEDPLARATFKVLKSTLKRMV